MSAIESFQPEEPQEPVLSLASAESASSDSRIEAPIDVGAATLSGSSAEDWNEGYQTKLTSEQMRLFYQHYGLVEELAWKIASGPTNGSLAEEMEEALANGYLGLVKACLLYDSSKRHNYATTGTDPYFYSTIRGEILKGIRARIGRNKNGTAKNKLSVINGTVESLDRPLRFDDDPADTTLHDLVASPERDIPETVLVERILVFANQYSPDQRELIVRSLGLEQPQSKIAKAMGVSQMAISRRQRKLYADMLTRLDVGQIPEGPSIG